MNEEEKFDELLSSKLAERDFPFDELNWDDAERLLIQQERRAKITKIALTFSAGLAAGVIIMLPFIINSHSNVPNDIVSKSTGNQNTIAQNTISAPAIQSPVKQANANTANDIKETTPLPVQSAFVKKDTRTGIRSVSSNTTSPIITKTPKQQKSVFVADVNTPRNTDKLQANSNTIASSEKKSEYVKTINHQEANPTEEVSNASSQPLTTPVVENATQSNTIPKTEKTISTNSVAADKNNTDNTVVPTNTNPTNTIAPTVTASNKTAPDNGATPKPKADSAAGALPPMLRSNPPIPVDNHSSNILSVFAGGNYSFGWNDEGEKQGNGITPWAGFNFTHYFGNTLSIALGFGFSELNHLDQTYTNSLIQYDFGANATTTSISPQTVYYVDLPLKLQYTLGNKNIFGLGINYLLLMTTYSTLSTYQQTYFSETPGTSTKQLGYTQGFSNSDMQLTLSYTRMVAGRIGIGAEYYYDNNYLENNTVPGINQNAKNSGIRVFLTFQLVK